MLPLKNIIQTNVNIDLKKKDLDKNIRFQLENLSQDSMLKEYKKIKILRQFKHQKHCLILNIKNIIYFIYIIINI